jgi:hypothetical protein
MGILVVFVKKRVPIPGQGFTGITRGWFSMDLERI